MTSSLRCQVLSAPPTRLEVFERQVAIAIPARNEARHLPALVRACRRVAPAMILVVDDGSDDDTPQFLEAASREAGAPLAFLRNEAPLGKQGAVRRALRALEPLVFDAVALIDGDGQHDPAELPGLAALLGRHDLVLGLRDRAEMPLSRQLSNWLVDRAFAWLAGVELGDVQSGLRLMRKPLADVLAARLPGAGGYALEHESLAVLAGWAAERGRALELAAAPIACRYQGSTSGIRPWHVAQLAAESVRQALRLRRAGESLQRQEVRPCQPLA
jgi:glycosyltransferase involved in cell wall biosynthesis